MLISMRLWQARDISRNFPEVNVRRLMGWCEKGLLHPRGRKDLVYGTGTPREFDLPNLVEIEMILALQTFFGAQNTIQYQIGDRYSIASECVPYLTGDTRSPGVKAILATIVKANGEDVWLTFPIERPDQLRDLVLRGDVVSPVWTIIHLRPLLDKLRSRV